MKRRTAYSGVCVVFSVCVAVSFVGEAEFTFDDNGVTLTVVEDGKPVLGYNYGRMDPPEGVDMDRFWRSSYIHPLYGLDGTVLTQDFPADHYHHRGVFWTWPGCKVGERPMDLWTLVGARQLFLEWIMKEAGADRAEVAVRNVWRFDDDPASKAEERVRFIAHRAEELSRCIDFDLTFTNVCQEEVTISGQSGDGKGYGGFCLRPDATRKPFTFTSIQGVQEKDVLKLDTPWADISWNTGTAASGVAIFQHAGNPGYPFAGWIMRHYGFLGASWPHLESYRLAPGASVQLRYRLYLHRGDAESGKVASAFDSYRGGIE